MTHDNRNHIGPNWNGRASRTLVDAFPAGVDRITLRRNLIEQERRSRKAHVVDVLMMAVFLLTMYGFMKAPAIWQWLVTMGWITA